jgi:hypothetical protein
MLFSCGSGKTDRVQERCSPPETALQVNYSAKGAAIAQLTSF